VTNAGSESAALDLPPLADVSPGIFALSQDGTGQGAILIAGTGLIARAARDAGSMPARKGDVVEIYCTGLGRLTDPPAPGQPAPLVRTVEMPQVTIGGAIADVLYSGLTPGLVGVYQVNARVPDQSATRAEVPVTIRIGMAASNTVTMAVL
jgi:uncharacterized protein (TIGR03437 family)